MTLNSQIDQYATMDRVVKSIQKRMKELNKLIKKELMEKHQVALDGHIYYDTGRNLATLQVKRSFPEIDEGALQQFLVEKKLWGLAKMEVVNRDFVKQLWIEGRITDKDLRSIISTKDPNTALRVESNV